MCIRRVTQNLGLALLLALVVAAGATLGAPHQVASAVCEFLTPWARSRTIDTCSTMNGPPQLRSLSLQVVSTEEMPINLPNCDLPVESQTSVSLR